MTVTNPTEYVLDALRVGGYRPKKAGAGWSAHCPAHEDNTPSLSINTGEDGRVLLKCHAGCITKDVCARLNIADSDLFVPNTNSTHRPHEVNGSPPKTKPEPKRPTETFATAREAVAKRDEIMGRRHSHTWTYHNAAGEPVGLTVRWDRDDGKHIRPVALVDGRWGLCGMPAPRPLYRLPTLADTDRIYIVEGEKCADAAIACGMIATTCAQGCNGTGQADWSPLSGKDVVILPDHDTPGEKYGAAVARLVTKAGARSVKIVHLWERWPDIPEGGDIADVLEAHTGQEDEIRAAVEALVDKAEPEVIIDLPNTDAADTTVRWTGGAMDADDDPYSDTSNAARFAMLYSDRLRHCDKLGGWLVWDGRRWVKDDTHAAVELAKAMGKQMLREAVDLDADDKGRACRWALKTQMARGVRDCLSLALAEPTLAMRADDFNTQPYSLNCENGTLDLRTGKLREHRPDDLLTQLAPVVFDAEAKAPVFRKFLHRIFREHPAVEAYVQRAIGYAAFGITSEQCLFVMHGAGANGKSTLVDVVSAALGDYAGKTDPELLIASRNGSHPTGVADLFGLRFAACSESNQGREFDEQRLKDLTGECRLKARYMRQDFFEFDATHTLFLATNHRPRVRGTELGTWRRMKLIPFTETITDDERDTEIGEKLLAELSGVLAWIVAGGVEWYKNGLNDPPEVMAAVEEYRQAEDVLGRWIDENCLTALGKDALSERAQTLYDSFKRTCEAAGEAAMTNRRFGEELLHRGYERKRTGQGNRWYGIALRANDDGGEL